MANTELSGLTAAQVIESRTLHGENLITPPKKTSAWKLYMQKYSDPMIIILLIAWALSVAISFYNFYISASNEGLSIFLEPAGILFAILLSTGLSFYFEQKADREFNVLNAVSNETEYKLIRDGSIQRVPKREIVVGDTILLEQGEEIPADGILLDAISLQVNESNLTGEPLAHKGIEPAPEGTEEAYPRNWIYRGTTVVEGHCVLRVEAVGDATETGKVFQGIQIENQAETPLTKQLTRLANLISKAGYTLAALLVLLRLCVYFYDHGAIGDWLSFGQYLLNTFMLAVTLLVVAVPEGLPMSVSLSLAYSMRSMMKTNNLVRRMHACETMGATTVICTDKTGTLTQNQMRVDSLWTANGQEVTADSDIQMHILRAICQNSTAHLEREGNRINVLGNPTEGALLLWVESQGSPYEDLRASGRILQQLTFSTQRKYMATLVQEEHDPAPQLYVKGAPEILLGLASKWINSQGELHPLDDQRESILKRLEDCQRKGMRTLALAVCTPQNENDVFANGKLNSNDLTILALVAISDPVRPDVPAAIQECRKAGIQIKIVTGDTILTAREIARQIGLWDERCNDSNALSGSEFDALPDEELKPRLRDLRILYRARPLDKSRLTRLLQETGEVVAVTGDGTNDAPALRAANVGLSMGDGTSVAKEASDITILDNSFVSIGQAVLWGRSLYLNIQRFILFQLTINFAACLVVLLGVFFDGSHSPLTVTQMLWVNLVMDTLAALALASLPTEKRLMRRKPRLPDAFIITPPMRKRIIGVGTIFVMILLGALYTAQSTHFAPPEVELSLFFSFFVFLQVWNIFNAKAFGSGNSAFAQLGQCHSFLHVVAFIAIGQWVLMNWGGMLFDAVPLSWIQQLTIIGSTSLVLWIGELTRRLAPNA